MIEHTSKKLWTRRFVYSRGDRDRKRSDKPVPGQEERILDTQTTPYGRACWYVQDLKAALLRKHMQHIVLAHEYVPLAQIDGRGCLNVEVDHLYE